MPNQERQEAKGYIMFISAIKFFSSIVSGIKSLLNKISISKSIHYVHNDSKFVEAKKRYDNLIGSLDTCIINHTATLSTPILKQFLSEFLNIFATIRKLYNDKIISNDEWNEILDKMYVDCKPYKDYFELYLKHGNVNKNITVYFRNEILNRIIL